MLPGVSLHGGNFTAEAPRTQRQTRRLRRVAKTAGYDIMLSLAHTDERRNPGAWPSGKATDFESVTEGSNPSAPAFRKCPDVEMKAAVPAPIGLCDGHFLSLGGRRSR